MLYCDLKHFPSVSRFLPEVLTLSGRRSRICVSYWISLSDGICLKELKLTKMSRLAYLKVYYISSLGSLETTNGL